MAEHGRLWDFCPKGCETTLQEAARPFFQAYSYAHASGDAEARGQAFDAIMTFPARALLRSRGGVRKTTKRLNTRLRYIAGASRDLLSVGIMPGAPPPPHDASSSLPPPPSSPALDPAQRAWQAKVRRAVGLARRGHFAKGLQSLTSAGMADMTPEVIDSLEECFTHDSSPIPAIPAETPPIVVDTSALPLIVKMGAHGASGGPSGWSDDILLVCLGDEVVLAGFGDLIEDICNNSIDTDSSSILRSVLMAAAHKKDPTSPKKRTLMLGEVFVKVASRYFLGQGQLLGHL